MLTRDNKPLTQTSPQPKGAYRVRLLLCLLLGLLPHIVFGPTVSSQANASDLRVGVSLTEQIPARTEREFPIYLQKGELFQFVISKGDLNVSIELSDPGGRRFLEYRSFSYEPIELCAVAETSGTFLLKVRSLETGQTQGQLSLTAQPVRRATGDDARNAAATNAIAAATSLSAEWSGDSFHKAIDNYVAASTLARNPRLAAAALRKAGETYFVLGEYKQALNFFERTAALSQRAGEQPDALEAAAQVARVHSSRGDNDNAQRELNRVLSFYSDRNIQNETAAIKHAYAQTLSSKGEIYYSKGDSLRSVHSLERALKLFEETGDRDGQARALLLMGHNNNMLGQFDQALSDFSRSYNLYRETGNRSGGALATTAKGLTLSLDQKNEEGIKLHREAQAIFKTIGDRQSEAITLNAIGQAYQHLSKNELALEQYKQSLQLLQSSGGSDFAAATMLEMASVYRKMNRIETSLAYFEECARVSREGGKNRMEAYALNEIASIYAQQGRHKEALNLYSKFLRSPVSLGDPRGRALTLNKIGDLLLTEGRKPEALATYQRALPFSEKSNERVVEIETLFKIALAALECNALDEAKSYIERSINLIEMLRANVASPDFRSSYFSGLRKHYDLYIALLMQLAAQHPGQGFVEEALIASERSRARAFLELLVEAGADIRQGVDPAILKREKELQSLLAYQARHQMEATGSSESEQDQAALNERLDSLKAEYEELQAKVRNQSPQYQTLARPKPLTIREIQGQLRQDDLLLEYSLGEKHSYLWAVTSTSVKGYELKPKAVLDEASLDVYRLLTARQSGGAKVDDDYQARVQQADSQYYNKAQALSRMLLDPVADSLGKKRLLVVAEGFLQFIPFEALPPPTEKAVRGDDGQDTFLIADHEIVVLPSVSALAAIRAESNRVTPTRMAVAVFADPVFSRNDDRVQAGEAAAQLVSSSDGPAFRGMPGLDERGGLRRLTYSSEEADSISTAASGAAWIVKGFDASRDSVMTGEIGQYQIVHFATHGWVNTERPELSVIVLTMIKPDGTPTDGFLQLHDVFNLKLSAELTVLSACDTGLGKDVRGEGLIGLTRGLMFAGSRSVVASLWKVDDRATAVLMGHFYKAMLQDGLPRAAALRYAKEQLRKDPAWSSPFFWAGFILQGEYDRPITVEQTSRVFLPVVIAMIVAAVLGGLLIFRRLIRARE
jgi:CHAT domain-containing protein/tetratricopeptide (TPR) repeat protein